MGLPASRLFATRYFLIVCAVSIGFVLVSGLLRLGLPIPGIAQVRRAVSLEYENNLGAWWSGMLLMMSALHACDAWRLHRVTDPSVSRAWLIMALVLLALSLDEVGSLHERVSDLPFGTWWSLLPFGVVFAAAVAWAVRRLATSPAQRRSALVISCAFALFVLVAVQEQIEHSHEWKGWVRGVRLMIEEGTEVAAMLMLFSATDQRGLPASGAEDHGRMLWATRMASPALYVALFVVAVVFAMATAELPLSTRGRPADWLSAVLFACAALGLVSGHPYRKAMPGVHPVTGASLLAVASALCILVPPESVIGVGASTLSLRLSLLWLTAMGAIVVVTWGRPGSTAIAATAMAILIGIGAAMPIDALTVYLLSSVLALFSYGVAAYAHARVELLDRERRLTPTRMT